jgi:hypothetical protein
MRHVVLIAALAATVFVPFGIASADQLTINARPAVVRWGQATMLTGIVPGGTPKTEIVIEGKECGVPGAGFREFTGAHPDERGFWSQQTSLRTTTTFRVIADGKTGGTVTVRQRPYVQLRRLRAPNTYDAGVNALVPFWRRSVEIQRFDKRLGRWTTIRKVLLTEQSAPGVFVWTESENFKLAVPKGTTLRAVLPAATAKPCYLAGYGNIVRT